MFDLYITQDFSHKPRDVNFSCRLSVLTRSLSLFLPSTSGNHVNIFGYLDRFMVPSKLPQRLFLWFSKEGDESLFSFSPRRVECFGVVPKCVSAGVLEIQAAFCTSMRIYVRRADEKRKSCSPKTRPATSHTNSVQRQMCGADLFSNKLNLIVAVKEVFCVEF